MWQQNHHSGERGAVPSQLDHGRVHARCGVGHECEDVTNSVAWSTSRILCAIHGAQLIVSRCFLALSFSVCLSIFQWLWLRTRWCGHPCDTLSCLFFSALWLQRIHSIFGARDLDTFPIKAVRCLQIGPISLDWLGDPFARFDHSDEQQRRALPASTLPLEAWNHTFTDGRNGSFPFLHISSRLLNLTTLGGTPLSSGSHVRCQELIVSLSIYLWLKHEISTATLVSLRIWRSGPFRVITQQCDSLFKSQQFEDTRPNAFQAECPKFPFSVQFSNGFTTTTVFLLIRSVHSQDSKLFLRAPRNWRFVNSHGRHLTTLLLCVLSQKSTSWDAHAMLWGMEAYRQIALDHCDPYSWNSCGTWNWDFEFPWDANNKRHNFSQNQRGTQRLVYQETCVISQWRRPAIPWKTMNQEKRFSRHARKARSITSTKIFSMCSTSSWWHQLDHW